MFINSMNLRSQKIAGGNNLRLDKINKRGKVYFITLVAMLSALSSILVFIGGIPIIPMATHLKVDFSEIPCLIGSIIISPSAGFLIELIKSVIGLMKTHTMGIGETMNFIVGSTLILSFSLSFKWIRKNHSLKTSFFLSYIICMIITCSVALITNSIVYPLFFYYMPSSAHVTKNIMTTYLLSVLIMNIIKITVTVFISNLIIRLLKGHRSLKSVISKK